MISIPRVSDITSTTSRADQVALRESQEIAGRRHELAQSLKGLKLKNRHETKSRKRAAWLRIAQETRSA